MKKGAQKSVCFLLMAVLLTAAVFLVGCGDRENPVDSKAREYRVPTRQPINAPALNGNQLQESSSRVTYVYEPPGHVAFDIGPRFPVLYLLHDYGFDYQQFEIFDMYSLVDDLIARGEIEPMLIVTIDASTLYGLGMYTNSRICGNHEDLILVDLIENTELRTYNVHTRAGAAARAIGGIGFGGQAAIKFAIEHPEMFSSVSAINAPLAYAGDGVTTNGLQDLFKYYFIENNVAPGDYDRYREVRDNPVPSALVTNMLYSMASAYSPNIDLDFLRPWTVRDTVPGYTDVVYFDLPFDHQLYVEGPVWDRWMEHDVFTLLSEKPNALDDIPVYLDAGDDNQYGFQYQTRIFAELLNNLGVDYTYHTYRGTVSLNADDEQMVATRLTEMLKFHSAHLAQPYDE